MNPRNGKSRPDPPPFRQNAVIGTVCLVLCVALSLGFDALLHRAAGEGCFAVSLGAAFLAVLLLYGKLEEWSRPDPEPPQTLPGPPAEE